MSVVVNACGEALNTQADASVGVDLFVALLGLLSDELFVVLTSGRLVVEVFRLLLSVGALLAVADGVRGPIELDGPELLVDLEAAEATALTVTVTVTVAVVIVAVTVFVVVGDFGRLHERFVEHPQKDARDAEVEGLQVSKHADFASALPVACLRDHHADTVALLRGIAKQPSKQKAVVNALQAAARRDHSSASVAADLLKDFASRSAQGDERTAVAVAAGPLAEARAARHAPAYPSMVLISDVNTALRKLRERTSTLDIEDIIAAIAAAPGRIEVDSEESDAYVEAVLSCVYSKSWSLAKRLVSWSTRVGLTARDGERVLAQGLGVALLTHDDEHTTFVHGHLPERVTWHILSYTLACAAALRRDMPELVRWTRRAREQGKTRAQFLNDSDFAPFLEDREFLDALD